jgi:Ni/Co efflux regulator RcnB
MKLFHVGLLALALAAPAAPAMAKHKAKVKVKDDKVVMTDANGNKHVMFVDADRAAYRTWWQSTYHDGCPSGLVRHDNYCVATGQTSRRYVVGQALPSTIVIADVPTGVRLRPAPAGYRYAYVDGDLLLINSATRTIADVIQNILH